MTTTHKWDWANAIWTNAAARQMTGMTGLQDGFETPLHPDAVIPTYEMTVEEAVECLRAVAAGC